MRKREEITNPNSCLNKARDDEWLFVLLGRDLAAITAVRAWIRKRIQLGKNKSDDYQIYEARQWCIAVRAEQLRCKKDTCSPKMKRKAAWMTRRGRGARNANSTLRPGKKCPR